jgi:transposase
VTSNR